MAETNIGIEYYCSCTKGKAGVSHSDYKRYLVLIIGIRLWLASPVLQNITLSAQANLFAPLIQREQ